MLTLTVRGALLFAAFLSGAVAAETSSKSPASTTPASPALFDYDRSASLDIRDVATTSRDGAIVREITFIGVETPVRAYIVTPGTHGTSLAGILYAHWLGDADTSNA